MQEAHQEYIRDLQRKKTPTPVLDSIAKSVGFDDYKAVCDLVENTEKEMNAMIGISKERMGQIKRNPMRPDECYQGNTPQLFKLVPENPYKKQKEEDEHQVRLIEFRRENAHLLVSEFYNRQDGLKLLYRDAIINRSGAAIATIELYLGWDNIYAKEALIELETLKNNQKDNG